MFFKDTNKFELKLGKYVDSFEMPRNIRNN